MKNERGAVLVVVAAGLVVLLGASALAIDMGYNLAERRQLITATDAAALAAAESYAVGENGCASDVAESLLQKNSSDAVQLSCEAFGDTVTGTLGWVIVEAELEVSQLVAPAVGFDTSRITSRSLAVWGAKDGVVDPPPVGVCLTELVTIPNFLLWLLTGPDSTSGTIRLDFSPDFPIGCGFDGNNMALLDLNAGVDHDDELAAWFDGSYSDKVEIGWHSADPLTLNGTHHEQLRSLVEEGNPFWMPIILDVQENVPGAAVYVVEFIAIRLLDFDVTSPPEDQYFEFIIDEGGINAGCCALPGAVDFGGRETALFEIAQDGTPIGLGS